MSSPYRSHSLRSIMSLRDMSSYRSSMAQQYWGHTGTSSSSSWRFVWLLTAYKKMCFHQSEQQNLNSKHWWTRGWVYAAREWRGSRLCVCVCVCVFLGSYLYVLVNASAHLYMSVRLHVFMDVLRGSPLLYLGRVSSSLSSITRGKWNTFVSDCCMVRGGQINAFN